MTKTIDDETGTSSTDNWESRGRVRTLMFMALTIGGVYLCYLLTVPFFPALTWAVTLAILLAPIHRRIEARLKRANLAASASVLLVALIAVVPILFLVGDLIEEAQKGALVIEEMVGSGEWRREIEAHPRIAPIGHWVEKQLDLPATIAGMTNWLTNFSAKLVQGSLVQLVGILLTFYLLFYFLRDRAWAIRALQELSPLSDSEMAQVFTRVVDTVHATIYGTLAVAVVQGTLGGLMFWWLDLPAPVLWGAVMGMLAIVPVLGAFIIWIPAAIFLALSGNWGNALILTAWGAAVVGGIDNVLYPMLVGNRLKMHTVPAFISIVGGLIVFGASGLILGPLTLTITTLLLEIWRTRIAQSK